MKKLLQDLSISSQSQRDLYHSSLSFSHLSQNFPKLWDQIFKIQNQSIKDVWSKILTYSLNRKRVDDKVLRVYWMELSSFVNLHSLKNLQAIHIELIGHTEITSLSVQYLGRKLTENWYHLQNLTLDFRSCSNITDDAVEAITVAISRNLTKLQSLKLYFIEKITDKSLKILGKQIGNNLVRLQELSIFITAFISDEGISAFSHSIFRPLSLSLQYLTLNFSTCWKISDLTPEILIKTILKHLTKLKKLTLIFVECGDLTNETVKVLETQLTQRKPNLEEVAFHFKWCSAITTMYKNSLKKALDFIPKVLII